MSIDEYAYKGYVIIAAKITKLDSKIIERMLTEMDNAMYVIPPNEAGNAYRDFAKLPDPVIDPVISDGQINATDRQF